MSVNSPSFPNNLSKYQILAEIGRGGFGVVYRARDTLMDSPVALKMLAPYLLHDPAFVERFRREAHLARTLKHPNIVLIYDLFAEQGAQFLVMELVEGTSLDKLIGASEPMPFERVIRIAEQVASALDYAHSRNVIHRDIKPSNILVGEDDHVTLTDFGLAKAASGTVMTTTGTIGSPAYMSPEQVEGEAATARSDLYSFGVVLYELLTGRVPFTGETPLAVMRAIADKPAPFVSQTRKGLPANVDATIQKALVKKPGERFANNKEMLAALSTPAQPVIATPTNSPAIHDAQPGFPIPELIKIPAGEFTMGADNLTDAPVHNVYLDEYWIGKYPVTNAEYAVYVQEAGVDVPTHWEGKQPPKGLERHPVVRVSWQDAIGYCRWLRKKTGKEFNLPTEAQWEKAARGTDAQDYPYDSADMSYIMWEWCIDWYDKNYYIIAPNKNPVNSAITHGRVLRGGAFGSGAANVRCASRNGNLPSNRNGINGFRVCALPSTSGV